MGIEGGPWESLLRAPLRIPLSSTPWRSAAYLVSGFLVIAVWLPGALVLLVAGGLTWPIRVGVPVLRLLPRWAVALGRAERARLRLVDDRPAPSPHDRPAPSPHGRSVTSTRALPAEAATWREAGHGLLLCLLGPLNAVFVVVLALGVGGPLLAPVWGWLPGSASVNPSWQKVISDPALAWGAAAVGLLLGVVAAYLLSGAAAAEGALARTLLTKPADEELELRLIEVDRSRARLADAFDDERRRLERDLHDGTQQRLTGLIMTLGLARMELSGQRAEVGRLVDRAYDEARDTLVELQALVRGIHPAILTDRGLPGALSEAARRCPVPVTVRVEGMDERPPAPVESAVYFAGCEALTNLAKHSGAGGAELLLRGAPRQVFLQVRDDGVGGADIGGGTGLTGLADRVAAVGGTVSLSSPEGEGTTVRVEVSWTS
ncbi:sensor domain-containing protein [Nonomuraea sp. SMC257]|uniref:histidine kinase n=1 Tax=Nonomuraea montanisoli TaxID=2741721 RepID=A0A7Y6I8B0_9ACTN|nr:sensor histidine kinase [Nonomuraea montanisoli]NUW33562.1 sensor domain-containing protein [Nonomuraea montanisoli]